MKKDGERAEKVETERRMEGRKDVPSHVVLAASQQLLMKHFGSVPDSSRAARSALSSPILPPSEFNAS